MILVVGASAPHRPVRGTRPEEPVTQETAVTGDF